MAAMLREVLDAGEQRAVRRHHHRARHPAGEHPRRGGLARRQAIVRDHLDDGALGRDRAGDGGGPLASWASPTTSSSLAFGLILGSVAVAVAIAFGVGGRDAAKRLLDRWTTGA